AQAISGATADAEEVATEEGSRDVHTACQEQSLSYRARDPIGAGLQAATFARARAVGEPGRVQRRAAASGATPRGGGGGNTRAALTRARLCGQYRCIRRP